MKCLSLCGRLLRSTGNPNFDDPYSCCGPRGTPALMIPPAGAIVVALIDACVVAEELLLLGAGGGALSEVEVGSNVVSAAGLLVSVVET